MKPQSPSTARLFSVAVVSILAIFGGERYGSTVEPHPAADDMRRAVLLAERYFSVLDDELSSRGFQSQHQDILYGRLLGLEYSELTTTLGSFDAKVQSLNPSFAALVSRYLREAGIDSGETVGVGFSGSFPGVAISVMAALAELGVKAEVISSLGASTFGANRPELTWADIEEILVRQAGMPYRSSFVTPGGEGDNGGGIAEAGMSAIRESAERTGRTLVLPETLERAIDLRMAAYQKEDVRLLINIGGNQTMLGRCVHASGIPNGFHERVEQCRHPDRGVIARMNEDGISVVNLLNLRGLADGYGIGTPSRSAALYEVRRRSGVWDVGGMFVVIAACVVAFNRREGRG